MRHFKLTIAYDGTDFHGWQMQGNKPTIQGEIVNVLQRLTQEKIFLHGAGRTDAGVHALGQVASFKTQSGLSSQEFQRALNALLPPAIRIVAAEEVGPDFHARWSALRKTYRYRLYRGKVVPPPLWRYVLHYPFPLDEDAMRAAAARFVGTHDFTALAASADSEDEERERSTEREIYSAELARTADNEELVFTVSGLLKSWATPPASRPTASIFCAWRSRSSDCRSASSARLRSMPTASALATDVSALGTNSERGWRANMAMTPSTRSCTTKG